MNKLKPYETDYNILIIHLKLAKPERCCTFILTP